MKKRFLNVAIATIRFDKVPPAVSSNILERTVLPLYGDILEWEYTLRRYASQMRVQKKVFRDLRGKIGAEVLRLIQLGLSPVFFVQFSCREFLRFRVEVDQITLQRLAKRRRSLVMTFPSTVSDDQYCIEFSNEFIRLLASYGFSLEIM